MDETHSIAKGRVEEKEDIDDVTDEKSISVEEKQKIDESQFLLPDVTYFFRQCDEMVIIQHG